jgi:UDP-2,3-diacylglucosamine pyrophosphatase LpxH
MPSAVVISDTHFGLDSSTLANRKAVDELFGEIWRFGPGCDEAMLLGDIFDFWRVRPEKAIRDSRHFFQRLSEHDLKVKYVVGNHDHHLAVMSRESDFLERAARGDLYPIYTPNLRWSQVINGLQMEMRYPIYRARCNSRTYLFTHGHHLDGVQAFSISMVEQLRRLSGEEISPADLEMMMTYAYESIYRSSYIGEMVDFEERLWKVSSMFQRFKAGLQRTFRFTPVERQYDAILRFIRDQSLGKVDCFIYGDTHKADLYQKGGGPMAINTGSFTREDGRDSEDLPNTYMIMDEEGLALRQLGRPEPLFLCEYL